MHCAYMPLLRLTPNVRKPLKLELRRCVTWWFHVSIFISIWDTDPVFTQKCKLTPIQLPKHLNLEKMRTRSQGIARTQGDVWNGNR